MLLSRYFCLFDQHADNYVGVRVLFALNELEVEREFVFLFASFPFPYSCCSFDRRVYVPRHCYPSEGQLR